MTISEFSYQSIEVFKYIICWLLATILNFGIDPGSVITIHNDKAHAPKVLFPNKLI